MILVTGAAGKTGLAVIRKLSVLGESVRALVYRDEQVEVVKTQGAQEALVGDMRDRSVLARAVQGVRKIYHICPNISPNEVTIGETLIDAALSAEIEVFVYHSVLHPQTKSMPHHWLKLQVEEMIIESGLVFTILQPAAYMQNILAHWEKIIDHGSYPVPYPVEARMSMVDLENVAQAAAVVLTEPGHEAARYELVGTTAMSQLNLAEVLSEQLGRPVTAKTIPLKEWEQNARRAGLGDYQVETLMKMFQYYQTHGFGGNPNVLEWLIHRPPTGLAEFVKRVVNDRMKESV